MSSKLGTLTLDLVARIGNFTGPIQRAENQANSSFKKMREYANTYGAAIATVGAGAVVALAGMAVEYANQADELERMAFKANATTQEFQKMATGAAAFGIEGEQLADIMKDFNEKLGELTSVGGGGGIDFFEKIAVKTEGSADAAKKLILEMQKLSGPQALQMYVDKLQEAGVTQQQMSFYLESMGSDLTNLIPLLVNGGEGFKLYGDLAERAGIIMSDSTRESAIMLKDQIFMLDLQLQGAKNQLMQAVIPAFVDIASAFFDGSEEGVQFTSVAEGIADSLRFIAKVAIGAATAIQVVGKFLGGVAATASAILTGNINDTQAIEDAMLEDLNATVLAAGDKLSRLDSGVASSQAKQLRALRQTRVEAKGVAGGMDELVEKQNKAAKSSEKHTKGLQSQNKAYEEGKRLLYEYATEFQKIDYDLVDELDRIQESSLKDAPKTRMLAEAKKISEARKQVALLEYEADLDSWSWTEEKKLEKTLELEKQKVLATKGMSDGEKKERLKSLEEIHKNQMAWLQLEQAERLSNAQEIFRTDLQNMEARYEIERAKISKDLSISPEDREVYINASYRSQDRENDSSNRTAWTDYQSAINIDTSAEGAQAKRNEALQAAFEWQLITQEEYQAKLLASEQQYQADRASLAFSSGESIAGSFSEMFKTIGGEQSAAYKAMFAIEKGFAIAQSIMAIQTGIANAMSLPFPANLGAAATVAMETANIVSTIQSISLTGMAHDGIANVPEEGTWLLSKGERVLNPQDNKALTNMINNGGGGGDVSIQVNVTDSGVNTSGGNTQNQKQLGDAIGNAVRAVIIREKRQGGLLSK